MFRRSDSALLKVARNWLRERRQSRAFPVVSGAWQRKMMRVCSQQTGQRGGLASTRIGRARGSASLVVLCMSARRGVGFDVKSPPKRAVRDMKAQFQGIRRMLTGASALAASVVFAGAFAGQALAEDLMGQPTPGAIDLQPAASVLKHDAIWFHNVILMPIITIITLFVAGPDRSGSSFATTRSRTRSRPSSATTPRSRSSGRSFR
jgi:mRNA-degrading endonuclease toxin of MazEF toxin-antitoxin module